MMLRYACHPFSAHIYLLLGIGGVCGCGQGTALGETGIFRGEVGRGVERGKGLM